MTLSLDGNLLYLRRKDLLNSDKDPLFILLKISRCVPITTELKERE
jgi:hypothetical protein